ncbi:MAG: hypothetical protein ACQERD_00920 [Campylobacterota bacterium]
MSRLSNILKDTNLYKKIAYAFNLNDKSFGLKKGMTRLECTTDLGLKTVKEFNNYFDPLSSKYFRIEELFIILESVDKPQQKIILDYICNKYDFTCQDTADINNTNNTLENILLNITATQGRLTQDFIQAIEDDDITDIENDKLNSIAYELRSLVRTFENRIKAFRND